MSKICRSVIETQVTVPQVSTAISHNGKRINLVSIDFKYILMSQQDYQQSGQMPRAGIDLQYEEFQRHQDNYEQQPRRVVTTKDW